MFEWYLNLHPVQLPFYTLLIGIAVYFGNLVFWFIAFKTMKQVMIGMEIDVNAFFYGYGYRNKEMKEVFLGFMYVPGYSIFWITRWIIMQWLTSIGKALKPLNK